LSVVLRSIDDPGFFREINFLIRGLVLPWTSTSFFQDDAAATFVQPGGAILKPKLPNRYVFIFMMLEEKSSKQVNILTGCSP
jgi:hypothetical protein